jgi:hypothetical protein
MSSTDGGLQEKAVDRHIPEMVIELVREGHKVAGRAYDKEFIVKALEDVKGMKAGC